jgi:deazaflavin-dependent oxidoreductase (nitroreductase family)
MATQTIQGRRNRTANPWITRLLRSPLHALLSGSTMLITFTGRKTGRHYTAPVNYVRAGNCLIVTSRVDHAWWRNLRGGAVVELRLRGRRLQGHAHVVEGSAAVADELLALLHKTPKLAVHFHIELDADGQPKHPEQLTRFAAERVLLRIGGLTPLPAARRTPSA